MSNLGVRVSCRRTVAVGKRSPDWSTRGKDGELKKPRRKALFNQVLINGFDVESGVTVKKVEPLTIHNDAGVPTKQIYIGTVNGRRVERRGYAYSHVHNGKTPGRWYYA